MSNPEKHPSVEELTAFSVGLLSTVDAAVVESHIGECSPCCETLLGLASDDTFVGLLQHTDCPEQNSEESIKHAFVAHPRYEIVGWIAKGGMGDVFKAEHRSMGRTVALKVINKRLICDEEVVKRFHREVRTAARLSHPNIVTAYDAEQTENIHFLVMEFVDGLNLARVVKEEESLPISVACEYLRQAAVGLQYAHEQGVVHRDIKPHNLMLSAGTIKILDFGLASLTELKATEQEQGVSLENSSLTVTGSIMGTPDFMSPEQVSNPHRADTRSDIYSLGATLYYLLAGQPPFASGSVAERLKRLADSEPQAIESLRPDVPKELSEVIHRMMSKDPDCRFQTAQEVANALTPFVANAPSSPVATQTQSSRGGKSWWPFHSVKTIAGAAAAALSLVLAGVVFVETDKGTLVIESVDDSVKVVISQDRDEAGGTYLNASVIDMITGSQVKRLPSGEYKLTLAKDGNEFELNQGGFVLRRGTKVVATVTRKPSSEPKALKKLAMPAMGQQQLILGGNSLSDSQVRELQAKADANPNDVESRLPLLGYYSSRSILNKSLRESHAKIACWLIENYPDSAAAGEIAARVMGTVNPLGYVKARQIWLDAAKAHDQNVTVLINASGFFLHDDRDLCEELLKKAQALEPDNTDITKKLAQVYQLSSMFGGSQSKHWEQNDKSMAQLERALAQSKEGTDVSQLLIDIAKTAFNLGQNDKSKQFADRLLKTDSTGDSVHYGNVILGRIALQKGEVENAGNYLLESARTSGSPVLNSFGPTMVLAKELLEKGQKDIVLQYFDLCEKFWVAGAANPGNKLKEWREVVKAGDVPDFGISLWR